MSFTVSFAPQAFNQLESLHDYVSEKASPQVASKYVSSIVDACENLRNFPLRGTDRSDIRPGLRITHHKGRVIIAFSVIENAVTILGIFYGGMDWQDHLATHD